VATIVVTAASSSTRSAVTILIDGTFRLMQIPLTPAMPCGAITSNQSINQIIKSSIPVQMWYKSQNIYQAAEAKRRGGRETAVL
jgi:hypothetical protein